MLKPDEEQTLDRFSSRDLVTDVYVVIDNHVEPLGICNNSVDEYEEEGVIKSCFYLPDPLIKETHAVIFYTNIKNQTITFRVVAPNGIGLSDKLPMVDNCYGYKWVNVAVSKILSILDGNILLARDSDSESNNEPDFVWLFSELFYLNLNSHIDEKHRIQVKMKRPGSHFSYASYHVMPYKNSSIDNMMIIYLNVNKNIINVCIVPNTGYDNRTVYKVDLNAINAINKRKLDDVTIDMALLIQKIFYVDMQQNYIQTYEEILENKGVHKMMVEKEFRW